MNIETNPYMSNVVETKDTEPKTKNNSVHQKQKKVLVVRVTKTIVHSNIRNRNKFLFIETTSINSNMYC